MEQSTNTKTWAWMDMMKIPEDMLLGIGDGYLEEFTHVTALEDGSNETIVEGDNLCVAIKIIDGTKILLDGRFRMILQGDDLVIQRAVEE